MRQLLADGETLQDISEPEELHTELEARQQQKHRQRTHLTIMLEQSGKTTYEVDESETYLFRLLQRNRQKLSIELRGWRGLWALKNLAGLVTTLLVIL